jgi:chaperonin GroEL
MTPRPDLRDARHNCKARRHPLPRPRRPAVTLQPQTHQDILRGTNAIVDVIRPTLGPLPRHVMVEAQRRADAPEFLDNGALIARRIIEISPRGRDVGAMLIRHALWQMHTTVGDGSATMAVLYQSILRDGITYLAQSGSSAMLLRAGLEKAMRLVLDCLHQQAAPLAGRLAITNVAAGMCQGDSALAQVLGEIFDRIGPDGLIVVEGWQKMGLEREYIEGTYWKLSGWLSRLFVTDPHKQSAVFEDAALLISDMDIQEPALLVPVLANCIRAGVKRLIILAKDMSERAVGLLAHNNKLRTIQTLAVRTPRVTEMDRVAAIEDIAVLTGGKPFYSAAYATFDEFRVEDLGHARRAWAMQSLFGIYEGRSTPEQLHTRIAQIRGMLRCADDARARSNLQTRLGQLSGSTTILRIGAIHEAERDARKAMAERAVSNLRGALAGGVVPGGGAALIHAQSVLRRQPINSEADAAAYRILTRAMEEPMRVIATNAGYAPEAILADVKAAPLAIGFDAHTGQIVDVNRTGILDPLNVLQKAVEIAISGAAMALTTDVIFHHREPKESVEP